MYSLSEKLHTRWMIDRDLKEIVDIENTVFDSPWDKNEFKILIKQRECIGMVIHKTWNNYHFNDIYNKNHPPIMGYIVYEFAENKLNLLNIAVHPDYQNSGIGTILVKKIIGKLTHERRNRICVYVKETNTKAQCFFKRLGFRYSCTQQEFYEDTDEDAYLLKYRYKPSKREIENYKYLLKKNVN